MCFSCVFFSSLFFSFVSFFICFELNISNVYSDVSTSHKTHVFPATGFCSCCEPNAIASVTLLLLLLCICSSTRSIFALCCCQCTFYHAVCICARRAITDVLPMKMMSYLKFNLMLCHPKFVNGWHRHLLGN